MLEKSRFFAVRGDTPRYAPERIFSNSGSSAHSGRAGSSPASRTKKVPKIAQNRAFSELFSLSSLFALSPVLMEF